MLFRSMKLYTTIFESTKEETNEQTGQLGLGSKSPFAYTDTFSVIAYMNGMRRVYIAYLERDCVPSITHVGDEPTDEPQGLEVAFPAKREDIRQFQREMQFVSMGYKTAPEVEGMDIAVPKPRLSGTNWAIYPNGAFGDQISHRNFIRQGSVIYPLDSAFPHVGYGWITVTEVPIGTAEVTASRESLSFDADTRRAIQGVHHNAYIELTTQIDALMAKAKTRIEKAKVYSEYNGVLDNIKGNTSVSLMANDSLHNLNHRSGAGVFLSRIPGDSLEMAAHFGKSMNARTTYNRFISSMDYQHLDRFHLLVNDADVKVVRRIKRIRNCSLRSGLFYVYDEADPIERAKGVAWITECFDLRADQITLVSSLPDCPGVKKAPGVKRVLKPGQYWMPRHGGKVISDYGISDRGPHEWPKNLVAAARQAGVFNLLDWNEIFWVTEKQQESHEKKGNLPADRRLDVVIAKAITAKVAKAPLDEAQTLIALHRMVGEYNKALPVVMEKFFPHIKITPGQAKDALALAEIGKVDLSKRPIVAKVDAEITGLIEQYPLLFQKSDRKHYEHYVSAVQNQLKSTTKEVSA